MNLVDQSIIQLAVDNFKEAKFALETYRLEMYPAGQEVEVASMNYNGPGIVQYSDNPYCPVDMLPVRLSNGNVWWYDLIKCKPV